MCACIYNILVSLLRMACRGCLECLLKLLNFLMTVAGLAMVGYGFYLFVKYKDAADTVMLFSPVGSDQDLIHIGRLCLFRLVYLIIYQKHGVSSQYLPIIRYFFVLFQNMAT
uniref:Tobamovirus multiplication protein 2A n=2 Tax=Gossypium raimondii TaxID=29730 RepID=A0A0D2PUH7_GOSRA|nr:hypothetical protein B456_008G138600 [Gossypium raimondii]KJB49799.1 hypothetical protein B456_008G138600 [Gossypium raimondii]